jgi:hypothetical protein
MVGHRISRHLALDGGRVGWHSQSFGRDLKKIARGMSDLRACSPGKSADRQQEERQRPPGCSALCGAGGSGRIRLSARSVRVVHANAPEKMSKIVRRCGGWSSAVHLRKVARCHFLSHPGGLEEMNRGRTLMRKSEAGPPLVAELQRFPRRSRPILPRASHSAWEVPGVASSRRP